MELSSADQIEQEFADELQNMSIKEEAAPVKKPSLARGFSEIDPNNEAAARGTSAQKQGSFSARQLPDEPSYRVALQSGYGSVAPPLARTFTERDPSSPGSPPPPKAAPAPKRTFTEPERPFPPPEPASRRGRFACSSFLRWAAAASNSAMRASRAFTSCTHGCTS